MIIAENRKEMRTLLTPLPPARRLAGKLVPQRTVRQSYCVALRLKHFSIQVP